MKRLFNVMVILLISSAVFLLNSCKKNEEPVDLTLTSMHAGASNLNMATPATGVPLDTSIEAGFSTKIDPTTATTENVTLLRNYDNTPIDISISVYDTAITVKPTEPLGTGTQYTLTLGMGIKSTDGKALMTTIDRSFTTIGTFAVPGAVAQWTFDGNANDVMGNFDPSAAGMTNISFVNGRNTASGQAAQFNGTSSLIEIPNGDQLDKTNDFSLSFWVKEDTTGNGDQFVMGLAGWYGFQFEINKNGNGGLGECKLAATYSLSDGTSASQDLWFNGGATGTTKDNGGWKGFTFCKDLTSNGGTGVNGLLDMQWAHVVCTYNSATKIGTLYINGQKMKEQDFNLYGSDNPMSMATGLTYAGNPGNNTLVFGFIQDKTDPTIPDSWADYSDPTTGHFKGELDDVIIYHKVLTPDEITLMYNSGK